MWIQVKKKSVICLGLSQQPQFNTIMSALKGYNTPLYAPFHVNHGDQGHCSICNLRRYFTKIIGYLDAHEKKMIIIRNTLLEPNM